MDLADSETRENTEELIRRINPVAPLYRTVKGDVDLALIMGISAYTTPPQFQAGKAAQIHSHENCEDPSHTHEHPAQPYHYELRGISSLQVSCPLLNKARYDKLDEWLRVVLWDNRIPGSSEEIQVLRCKGLITMESGEQYVLQGVRSMYEMGKVEAQKDIGLPQLGKIVLIGKGLDDTVRYSLENILA